MNRPGVCTSTHDVVAGFWSRDASKGENDAASDEVGEEGDSQDSTEDDTVHIVQLHLGHPLFLPPLD